MDDIELAQIQLDGEAQLIADHPTANSTTMHSRLIRQHINLCISGTAYLPSPAKPP